MRLSMVSADKYASSVEPWRLSVTADVRRLPAQRATKRSYRWLKSPENYRERVFRQYPRSLSISDLPCIYDAFVIEEPERKHLFMDLSHAIDGMLPIFAYGVADERKKFEMIHGELVGDYFLPVVT
jgi:hypothetical protein